MTRSSGTLVGGILAAIIAAGCASTPPSPTPSPSGLVCPAPTGTGAMASVVPPFGQDIFKRDESRAITQDFLDGLARLYSAPDQRKTCALFTERGLASAIAVDWRLRDVMQADLRFVETHVLRLANEGDYDLRRRPVLLPIDAVFDISAGAIQTASGSGNTVRTSTADERVGFHLDLTFDGATWLVDRMAEISPDSEQWVVAPTPIPPAPRCSDFVRGRPGGPFDEDANRRWCDADGRGRMIVRTSQISLFTRYPCEAGHAAILSFGDPLGAPLDPLNMHEYVRDPAGEFLREGWIKEPFDIAAVLPDDAAYSGWTNGNIELWTSPTDLDRAAYLVRGKTIERWPRAVQGWGVIDCN
jgi:hypothetical protein